jgi:hypothetical protein
VSKTKYGPAIGTHLGKPIFSTIESDAGKFKFDRLAECDREGCPLDQLRKDELMFNPGLIYKSA